MTNGRLEITIKINVMPQASVIDNQWMSFELDCNGVIVAVAVKPKTWKKLEEGNQAYPSWVAAISGKIEHLNDSGFRLKDVNIQVYEITPKPKPEAL